MMDNDIFVQFNRIKDDYKILQDTDMKSAYDIMKRSSILLYTIEAEVANLYKELHEQEQIAQATKAHVSSLHSTKVTVGDRYADAEESVMAEVTKVGKIKEAIRLTEAAMKFLQRAYFDTKNIASTSRKEFKYDAEDIQGYNQNRKDWKSSRDNLMVR